jgi:hypothetical protein
MKSQNEQIKNHLESGKTLTALQALRKFNCLRLSGRIYDLSHDFGMPIKSEMVNVQGKRVARYSLETINN